MTLRLAPWVILSATLGVVTAAVAQGGYGPWHGGIRGACFEELHRFCGNVPPGGGRIIECLMSYRSHLSPACRANLGRGPAARGYGPGPNRNGGYGPDPYGYGYGYGPNPYGYRPYGYGPPRDGYGYSPGGGYGPGRSAHNPGSGTGMGASGRGDSTGSITTKDRQTRTYVIHKPKGYDAGKSYPLVLLFHGGGGAGVHILSQTHFAEKADQAQFIVVAPDGIDAHWNDGRGTTNVDVDDVGFVRQLIDHLKSHLSIDPQRIYATGLSNGADFTERLGCELSDTLAAIGAVAGPLPANLLSSCKPGPISMVGIQGDADPGIPIAGGEMGGGRAMAVGGVAASATQTMGLWAHANGCNPKPTVTREPPRVNDGTRVIKYSFTECTAGTGVTFYVVEGMGHGWPPQNNEMRMNGSPSQNINATEVIWNFFNEHPRQKPNAAQE